MSKGNVPNFSSATVSINDVDSLRYSISLDRSRIMIEGGKFDIHIDLDQLDTFIHDLNEASQRRKSNIVKRGELLRPEQWRDL